MKKKLPIGVLVSGSGSNLQAIIDSIDRGRLNADIKAVISNVPDAYALTRARNHSLPTFVIPHEKFQKREAFDEEVVHILNESGVELVVMAGFMRIITAVLLDAYPGRIVNIHPALLPSFRGMHAQRQAVDYGVKFSGCTVHIVDSGVDSGPIIIQAVVPVLESDTEETLSARILQEEHRIYPQAIQFFASERIHLKNRKVIISEGLCEEHSSLHNPNLSGF
ncbi:MAG: Phosphoribosylglycinamide formyltransferase [Syntrophus sp. PtaU1.Bin005]|jgi:phosphoribosylglycinamide formyltransferase-1|uniref:phosphoribosylglycinamide formyltransferase n=1 Tax=Syntrophus TaxID=43773 RepID=UPI0009D5EF28|nr:MAG: Phosphoribosylglycinamide formyltransferase [Syntrophus sp. PtaB.Bin138]OPY83457.1 MAG: Phosphoribosylglycinamide formyltransferase [Syntrophus sp. PtaU1.Bin005]